MASNQSNIVFVFGDQWRAQATGYAGDPNVRTPNLDALAAGSVNFTNAVAGCPVCSPYRASLMTGQYPTTHGVFLNDVYLQPNGHALAEEFARAGYDTAYIGKWHIDGHGRTRFIPRERRKGFDYWKVLECTHDYNDSKYYGDADELRTWDGYDAIDQTRDAIAYLQGRPQEDKPFLLMLSWGPPHSPYLTAPQKYHDLYDPEQLILRPNVPTDETANPNIRADLAGYYAHCSALDDCIGELLAALDQTHLAENTIFVFTSDHGDMVGSRNAYDKQQPFEESIRVPFLLRRPEELARGGGTLTAPIDAPDIMPTLLGLCGLDIPETVEGLDYSEYIRSGDESDNPGDSAALLMCPSPFGNWHRGRGGREYRGVRTTRYTYVRSLDGPWLLFDNETDPYQLENLVNHPNHAALQAEMEKILLRKLKERGEDFLPGPELCKTWQYTIDEARNGVCIRQGLLPTPEADQQFIG